MVHGCMVYTERRAEMAAVSCGTSHASAVSTPLRWIFKNLTRYYDKKLFTHVESHASGSESARDRRVALYKKRSIIIITIEISLYGLLHQDWFSYRVLLPILSPLSIRLPGKFPAPVFHTAATRFAAPRGRLCDLGCNERVRHHWLAGPIKGACAIMPKGNPQCSP